MSESDCSQSHPQSARERRLVEAIEQADQIIVLTHPELSSAEMNTLTTHQYIVWKNEKKRLGLADDEGRLTLTADSESVEYSKQPENIRKLIDINTKPLHARIAELEKELSQIRNNLELSQKENKRMREALREKE